MSDHPPQCHCCDTSWLPNNQKSFFKLALGSLSSMVPALGRNPSPPKASKTAKYNPPIQSPGPNQTNSSSTTAPAATGSSSSATGRAGNGQSGVSNQQSGNFQAPQAPQTINELWILFGVQGGRYSLEVICISNASLIDNRDLFRQIGEFYCQHRGWFKRKFSPFRFQNCKSVKVNSIIPPWYDLSDNSQFETLGDDIVYSSVGESLPEDYGLGRDYEYSPRPPQQRAPLIAAEFFAVWLNECNANCWACWFRWHPPQRIPRGRAIITKIPKKNSRFDVSTLDPVEPIAFGMEADFVCSFLLMAMYYCIPVIGSAVFWTFWLVNNPGDWQNACVPLTTVLCLYGAIWSLHSMTKAWRK